MIAYLFLIAVPLMTVLCWFLSDMGLLRREGWRNERAMWKSIEARQPLLDRKARFKLYIEGEKQLMAEWEEAFDPVGTASAKDLAVEMRRAKDNAWLFGSPYKPVREYANQAVCFEHARSLMSNKQSNYKDFQLTVQHCERMRA